MLSCLWIFQWQMLTQAPGNVYKDFAEALRLTQCPASLLSLIFRNQIPASAACFGTMRTVLHHVPSTPAGLREETQNPSKSTRCNICLAISLGLPERPTQLSLGDRTWCWSLSQGLLPPWRWWEGDAGSSSWWEDLEWLFLCTEGSQGQSKPRSPHCPSCYTCQTLLIPPCHQDQELFLSCREERAHFSFPE